MKNVNPDNLPEKLSDDPVENLRLENEILQLTIKAELGGEMINMCDVPPELENEFLKNIIAFEHAFENAGQIKVFDLLNRPSFKKSSELDDEQIATELNSIISLLAEKQVVLEYRAEYSDRLKYAFITEEFFDYEMDDIQVPGMITHFCYEEFHPNHPLDIESTAEGFLSYWFDRKTDRPEYCWWLANEFIMPDGILLPKDEVLARIRRTLECYPAFTDYRYCFNEIHFELQPDQEHGIGHAAGTVEYKALLEKGETIHISGPFRLFMCREYDCWSIVFFVLPGFTWE